MAMLFALAAFMIPPALIWTLAYLCSQKSRKKRLAIFCLTYVLLLLYFWPVAILMAPLVASATLATVALFEFALAQDRR